MWSCVDAILGRFGYDVIAILSRFGYGAGTIQGRYGSRCVCSGSRCRGVVVLELRVARAVAAVNSFVRSGGVLVAVAAAVLEIAVGCGSRNIEVGDSRTWATVCASRTACQ